MMIASAQISVYPLGQDRFGPAIKAMGAALRHTAWLVRFGPMRSTIVVGENTAISAALASAFAKAAEPTGDDGQHLQCLPRHCRPRGLRIL